MCGLVGLALRDPAARPAREELEAMALTLVHRGPDDQGLHLRTIPLRRGELFDGIVQ